MKTVHEVYLLIKKDKSFIVREYLNNEEDDKTIGPTGETVKSIYSGNHMGFFWNVHKYCMKNYDIKNDEVRQDGVRVIEFRRVA